MNYKDSKLVLDIIKKSEKILINCHRSPDPDSVSSALSMAHVLSKLGKNNVTVISPEEIPNNCKFLPDSDKIRKVDFDKFDFENYDLLIILDSGNWDQVTGGDAIKKSKIKVAMIDHHDTNPGYGKPFILDPKASSACEVLERVYEDFGIKFDETLSTILLTGMIADTASFQTEDVTLETLETVTKLVGFGAERSKILFHLYKSKPLDELLLMGEMLSRSTKDEVGAFVWTAIPKSLSEKYPKSHDAKVFIANSFMQSVAGTDFGIVMEEKDEFLSASFRSRTDFDVAKIAEALGGGGHKAAAATRVYGLPFDEAVEKVLQTARKYAKRV